MQKNPALPVLTRCTGAAEEDQEEEEVYRRSHCSDRTSWMAEEMWEWPLFPGPQHRCWGHGENMATGFSSSPRAVPRTLETPG